MRRTIQEALRAIEALGRQLVVAEGAQQLAHEYVGLLWRLPGSHIVVDHHHLVAPFVSLEVQEPATTDDHDDHDDVEEWHQREMCVSARRALVRHDGVGVLLDGINSEVLGVVAGFLASAQRGLDQRAAAGADHHEHGRSAGTVLQRLEDGLLVERVLDGIALKGLVGLRLEVVHQRLQRRLEVVVVRRLELFFLAQARHLRVQMANVIAVRKVAIGVTRRSTDDDLDLELLERARAYDGAVDDHDQRTSEPASSQRSNGTNEPRRACSRTAGGGARGPGSRRGW